VFDIKARYFLSLNLLLHRVDAFLTNGWPTESSAICADSSLACQVPDEIGVPVSMA
jgi:hypothetical protein